MTQPSRTPKRGRPRFGADTPHSYRARIPTASKWRPPMRTFFGLIAALLSLIAPTTSTGTPSVESVRVVREFGRETELYSPVACRARDGHLYVLDRDLARIVVFDASGKVLHELGDDLEYGLVEAYDFTILANGDIAVVDIADRRVVTMDAHGRLVAEARFDHHPRAVAEAPDGMLVTNADPRENGQLLHRFTPDGTVSTGLARGLEDRAADALVRASHDRVRVVTAGDLLCVVHPFLSTLRILSWEGRETARRTIVNETVQLSRDWYLGASVNPEAASKRMEVALYSLDDLMEDTRALSTDGKFHGNYYVNDIAVHGDEIHALVGGQILVYDRHLELRRRIVIAGAGSTVYPHRLCLDEDGRMFVLDVMHHNRAYEVR